MTEIGQIFWYNAIFQWWNVSYFHEHFAINIHLETKTNIFFMFWEGSLPNWTLYPYQLCANFWQWLMNAIKSKGITCNSTRNGPKFLCMRYIKIHAHSHLIWGFIGYYSVKNWFWNHFFVDFYEDSKFQNFEDIWYNINMLNWKCAHTQLEVCTWSCVSVNMLNWKHAHTQLKTCTCATKTLHKLNWKYAHAHDSYLNGCAC